MQFEVRITHEDFAGHTLHIDGTRFTCDSDGMITIQMDDSEYARFLDEVDADEAGESGDFETEPKTDERQTEAWLDSAPSYGGTD